MTPLRIIVGITGASGIIYGVRVLERLRSAGVETHLVISKAAELTLSQELDRTLGEVKALATVAHPINNIGASIAGGSFRTAGMIVAPCSVRTLSEIASGVTSNLLTRSADVVLKERRRLVLLVRETPLHLGHLRSMTSVTEMGGIIMPPVPAFDARPQTLDDVVEHSVGRALDLFDIDTGIPRWGETLRLGKP